MADESGQTIVFAAVCMVVLIGFLGFAIDMGHLRYAKRQLQADADATALAAAREIRVCGVNNMSTTTCSYMTAAALSALAENEPGYAGNITLVTACGSTPGTGITLELHNGPCALGNSDPNHNKPGYVEVVISKHEDTYFARALGFKSMLIAARAEATRNLSPPCVYALDKHGDNAMDFTLTVGVKANCALIDESDSDNGLTGLVCLLASAPKISVAGNSAALIALGCPNVQTGVPPPTPDDPLAYLSPPDDGTSKGCGQQPKKGLLSTTYIDGSPSAANVGLLSGGLLGDVTFNPGVYCGGINIALNIGATIKFNPGIYVLRSKGGTGGLSISVTALSNITGNEVMFYNEGPSSGTTGGFNINIPSVLGKFELTAPSSGEYAGVLFFQPKTNTAQDNFLANLLGNVLSTGKFDGAIYAPEARVFYGVNAISTSNNILVAKDITFLGGVLSTFGSGGTASALGSPLVGDDAVLVQ